LLFFFSSRRRHTRSKRDWSSDVCSSDLLYDIVNYDDILNNRNRIPLITYNQYRKEKKKKFKNDPYQVANWEYNQNKDIYICPNEIGRASCRKECRSR